MPFVTPGVSPVFTAPVERRVMEQAEATAIEQQQIASVNADGPGFLRTLGAAAVTQTGPGAVLHRSLYGPTFEDHLQEDPDFDAFDYAVDIGRADLANEFVGLKNKYQADQLLEYANAVEREEQIVASAGLSGMGAIFASQLIDPTVWIPLTTGVRAIRTIENLGKASAVGAGLGAASLGIQEGVIAAASPIRDEKDAVAMAAMGAIFGGAVGGAFGTISSKAAKLQLQAEIEGARKLVGEHVPVTLKDGKLSADRNMYAGLQDAIDDKTMIASRITQPGILKSVVVEGLDTPSNTMKAYTNALFEHNLNTEGVEAGIKQRTAMSTYLNLDIAKAESVVRDVRGDYASYRAAAKQAGQKPLKEAEYNIEMAKATRREGKHDISQVSQSTKRLIALNDKSVDDLVKVGFSKAEDIDKIKGYLKRKFHVERIIAERNRGETSFLEIIADGEMAENARLIREAQKTGKDIPAKLERHEALTIATQKRDSIIRLDKDRAPAVDMAEVILNSDDISGLANFLKDRSIKASDEMLEDYLVNDAIGLTLSNARQSAALVRFKNVLDDLNVKSIKELKSKISEEIQIEAARAPGKKNWTKIEQDAIQNVDDFAKISLGLYTKGDPPSLRNLRKMITMMKLGLVTVSSIPDLGSQVLQHGLYRTVFEGYIPLLKEMFTNMQGLKSSYYNALDMDVATQLMSDKIMRQVVDPDGQLSRIATAAERRVDTALDWFGTFTGINMWNNGHRMVAAHLSVSRTLRSAKLLAEKGSQALSKRERQRLLRLGIDDDAARRIAKHAEDYADEIDGSFVPNFSKWDPDLNELMKASTLKEVDNTILRPNAGDMSKFAQTNGLTKLLFQFKSFAFKSGNAYTLGAVNRFDANIAQGLPLLTALGATRYLIGADMAGIEPDMSTSNLILEGISRSGILGLQYDLMSGLFGGSSRYQGVGATETVLGPATSVFADTIQTLANVRAKITGERDFSESDVRKLQGLIPIAGALPWRDTVNRAMNNAFGTQQSE